MLQIHKAGLQTTIQDYPGRIDNWAYGISPAGPLDGLSFRLGNLLVGNREGEAGIEIQFIGPVIEFLHETIFALTGADNGPLLNNKQIELWSSHYAKEGDLLAFGFAKRGVRTYLTVAGGIEVPEVMGSKATHVHSQLGGLDGRALRDQDIIEIGIPNGSPETNKRKRIRNEFIPEFTNRWEVEVVEGPYTDYLSEGDIETFFSTLWKVSPKSNRIGYRLDGPGFSFSKKAHDKPNANGTHPSNLIDYGCPIGAINICGQTPVILLFDGPSSTGYISPFTVITSALRKVGQARPGDEIIFRCLSKEEMQELSLHQNLDLTRLLEAL